MGCEKGWAVSGGIKCGGGGIKGNNEVRIKDGDGVSRVVEEVSRVVVEVSRVVVEVSRVVVRYQRWW